MRATGVLLIVLGIVALAYGGIRYTKHEKVLDVGPIEATVEHKKRIPLPPVAGAVALLVGTFLVLRRNRGHA